MTELHLAELIEEYIQACRRIRLCTSEDYTLDGFAAWLKERSKE